MRRTFYLLLASTALALAAVGHHVVAQQPPESRLRPQGGPGITRPILFDTAEADELLGRLQVFPPDNPWNQDISRWPLHPDSARIVGSIGARKPFRFNYDMGFVLVPPDQERVPVRVVDAPEESDPGPFPVPNNLPIEGWPASYRADRKTRDASLDDIQRDRPGLGGDRHAIVVDPVNRRLFEFYQAKKTDAGWQASCTAIFDLASNRLRPEGWTSTDAAGLPIFPAIVRHDELKRGAIRHALRVTVSMTRRAYVFPARHYASQSKDPALPRMGERLRLKRGFDTSRFSPEARVILEALKTYGMFVADNGLDWAISVAPDERIHLDADEFRRIKGADFEVVTAPPGASSRRSR